MDQDINRRVPANTPVGRSALVRWAPAGRVYLGLSMVLAGVGSNAAAQTQGGALVIETYATQPDRTSRLAPIASDTVARRSTSAALSAAYMRFARQVEVGQDRSADLNGNPALAAGSSRVDRLSTPVASSACGALAYRPSGMLSEANEETRRVLYPMVWREACSAGVPAGLLDALIIHESRYRVDAVSPKGAVGLTQLMPGTAANLGVNSWAIESNIRGGARYLRSMLDSFGQYHLALAAYNAGPGAVVRYGGVPAFRETQSYVGDIIRRWSALAGN